MGLIVVPEQYERRRQPAIGCRLNPRAPAIQHITGVVAPWARADARDSRSIAAWAGFESARGVGRGGIGLIGAGSNEIAAPAGYGGWAGNSKWGVILTFRLRSASQTNTYAWRQDVSGGAQVALIYGYTSQQFELFSNGYSGTDPRSGSGITVADTDVHTLAYINDGTRTRGVLDGRVVVDVAASTTFSSGASIPTYLLSAGGVGYCQIELYQLGFWAGGVPSAEAMRRIATPRAVWSLIA